SWLLPEIFIAYGRGLFPCRAVDNIENLIPFPRQQDQLWQLLRHSGRLPCDRLGPRLRLRLRRAYYPGKIRFDIGRTERPNRARFRATGGRRIGRLVTFRLAEAANYPSRSSSTRTLVTSSGTRRYETAWFGRVTSTAAS